MCLRRSPAFVAPSGLVADWTTSNWSWCCTTQNFPPDGRVCPAICDPPMRVALCAPRVALFLEHPDLPLGGPVCGCPGKRYGLPPAWVLLPRTSGPTGLPAVPLRVRCKRLKQRIRRLDSHVIWEEYQRDRAGDRQLSWRVRVGDGRQHLRAI